MPQVHGRAQRLRHGAPESIVNPRCEACRACPDGRLCQELVPVRITAPPSTDSGPTAQWQRRTDRRKELEGIRMLWELAAADDQPLAEREAAG